ncbi:MAG: ATP-dependent RNA helicase HrpA [Actinomycetales bacterium]
MTATLTIDFPPELPVSARRDDIAAAIREHQVVIVAGETGSGKTTQLPKICLGLGRESIAHTQPRRIAARAVAERVADELGTAVGDVVGYTVRFTDQVSRQTRVRVMTDGILLAQIQRDPMLRQYDTIIVDEAHERSLNIDFLLGYLHGLLRKRPDLKLIITSATIDSERFAAHFADAQGRPAPVIEVSGRTYPVEIRYRPVVDPDDPDADPDRDQVGAIVDAVAELQRIGFGDILVFCSGEREIRDATDGLADAIRRGRLVDSELVPLFARLSAAEQHRVFAPHAGRRIVLATNVAETSLTVPGIRYVIDTGLARISRYSTRTKVQRLPIEPISQASARQRAGRCGRTADGVAIRLYGETDYDSRPEYTDPEILRTNLASVILQMANIGLGDIAAFDFIDKPDPRAIRDGVALLEELHAIESTGRRDDAGVRLTRIGRRLVRIPVDPRLARMVLAADQAGCVEEVIVVVAALSIQDPRERPADHQQAADLAHARFADDTSDFAAYLNLWRYLREQQKDLSSSAFRRMCRREYLHFLRIREWQDLVAQLRRAAKEAKITLSRTSTDQGTPDLAAVHRSLLAGLLSYVGHRDDRERQASRGRRPLTEYQGARGIRFAIWPGSALAKKPPELLMAAEVVETSRLWARTVAGIETEWVEQVGEHLLKRSYSEPTWSAKRGSAIAHEKVTLYGVPIVADRIVGLGRIDPELARDLFIRQALVEGDWRTRHHFVRDNKATLERVADLEHRSRRRDIVVDDETIFAFYDARIPDTVVSGAHFDRWWRKARHRSPDLLTFTEDDLVREDAEQVSRDDFPDSWRVGGLDLSVGYRFDPGSGADGVTVTVPAAVLNQVDSASFEWQVPGLRHELVTALIRSLPKQYRRHLAPAPDNATRALERVHPGGEPLLPALARELGRLAGTPIPVEAFDWEKVPAHLRVRVNVTGERGRTVAAGKDVASVSQASRQSLGQALAQAGSAAGLPTGELTDWSLDGLPRELTVPGPAGQVTGFPALVDAGGRVEVQVLASPAEQAQAMRAGTRRLLLRLVRVPTVGSLTEDWDTGARLALTAAPHGALPALVHDVAGAVIDEIVAESGGPAWDATGFARLRAQVDAGLASRLRTVFPLVARVLASARALDAAIKDAPRSALAAAHDEREHLTRLIRPGFVTSAGIARLPDLQRYLQAALRRLDRAGSDPGRDASGLAQVRAVQDRWRTLLEATRADDPRRVELADLRWQLEELRVSLLAPGMPTSGPVSVPRIERALRQLTDG